MAHAHESHLIETLAITIKISVGGKLTSTSGGPTLDTQVVL